MTTDEAFGALGSYSGGSWDQFDANEQLFGITTSFDEAVYTTKLDRNAPDFKERERKAQQIADEINRVSYVAPLPLGVPLRGVTLVGDQQPPYCGGAPDEWGS
jgi:hypothetical protein